MEDLITLCFLLDIKVIYKINNVEKEFKNFLHQRLINYDLIKLEKNFSLQDIEENLSPYIKNLFLKDTFIKQITLTKKQHDIILNYYKSLDKKKQYEIFAAMIFALGFKLKEVFYATKGDKIEIITNRSLNYSRIDKNKINRFIYENNKQLVEAIIRNSYKFNSNQAFLFYYFDYPFIDEILEQENRIFSLAEFDLLDVVKAILFYKFNTKRFKLFKKIFLVQNVYGSLCITTKRFADLLYALINTVYLLKEQCYMLIEIFQVIKTDSIIFDLDDEYDPGISYNKALESNEIYLVYNKKEIKQIYNHIRRITIKN